MNQYQRRDSKYAYIIISSFSSGRSSSSSSSSSHNAYSFPFFSYCACVISVACFYDDLYPFTLCICKAAFTRYQLSMSVNSKSNGAAKVRSSSGSPSRVPLLDNDLETSYASFTSSVSSNNGYLPEFSYISTVIQLTSLLIFNNSS